MWRCTNVSIGFKKDCGLMVLQKGGNSLPYFAWENTTEARPLLNSFDSYAMIKP